MIAAGFRMVLVGIEPLGEESLHECGKAQNAGRDLVESLRSLQRKGLDVSAGFNIGIDHDTPSAFDRQIVRTIYSQREYFRRVWTFLSEFRIPKGGPKSRDRRNIVALLKVIWRIGIAERGRGYFWRLMLHVLGRYSSAFAEAIRMAITGSISGKSPNGSPTGRTPR
jgi:hypothetical protein